ncbi:hypothetical protein BGX33_007581 [Mortierella sp. NVP41]|nr:hypothetical protein BGX33_007581 [Mortierella sp. NVP41]
MPRPKKTTNKPTNNTTEPTTTDATSFGNLTVEIQSMVGRYLRPRDLLRCVRVSKGRQKVFNPYLWQHVEEPPRPKDHFPPPETFSQLTSLEIKCEGGDTDWIAGFTNLSSVGWKRLVFRLNHADYDVGFGRAAVEAILKHASTLEVLRVHCPSEFTSKDIQQLLCTAPNLKELVGSVLLLGRVGHRELGSSMGYTSLKIFGCQIRKISRSDITREIPIWNKSRSIVPGTAKSGLDLQRRVYAQLAKLTRLRQLILGVPYHSMLSTTYQYGGKEQFRQYDCLAFTLESGLDLLKDLRQLRVVQLLDTKVYIRKKEREWTVTNWPRAQIERLD